VGSAVPRDVGTATTMVQDGSKGRADGNSPPCIGIDHPRQELRA
jgi:hypothetical protein